MKTVKIMREIRAIPGLFSIFAADNQKCLSINHLQIKSNGVAH